MIPWSWIKEQKINFEPGIICRLKCPACFMREEGLHDRKMIHSKRYKEQAWDRRYNVSLEKYKTIFETFNRYEFCGNLSDPIYHPDFVDTLKHLKGRHKKILFRTNGSGKSKKWWEEVFKLCQGEQWKWTFALDGLPKDSHKYRINQDGEQVWEMMKLGREMFDANIEWQWIVFKYNQYEIQEGNLMAAQYGINFDYYHSTRWVGDLVKYKPIAKHAIDSRNTTNAKAVVKELGINIETITKGYESEEAFWNNYDNHSVQAIDIPKKKINEIDPDCLRKTETKDIMFNSMGYFIPCCEKDQWVKSMEKRGFYQEKFHIDNLHTSKDIKNVFMSDTWQDFWTGLTLDPANAPKQCQTFCRKTNVVKDQKGFV